MIYYIKYIIITVIIYINYNNGHFVAGEEPSYDTFPRYGSPEYGKVEDSFDPQPPPYDPRRPAYVPYGPRPRPSHNSAGLSRPRPKVKSTPTSSLSNFKRGGK